MKLCKNFSKRKKIVLLSVCYSIAAIFLAVIIAANVVTSMYAPIITTYLGHSTFKVINNDDDTTNTEYYSRKFTSEEQRLNYEKALCEKIEGEGIVLLKNESNALPLSTSERHVTLLGVASRDIIYGGTGSGNVDTSNVLSLAEALEQKGINVNQTAVNYYLTGTGKKYVSTTKNIAGGGEYVINECPQFTSKITNSYPDYHDAAIVVFNRAGSESSDLPTASKQDSSKSYLELTSEEEQVLTHANANFDKIIVLINSATPMELGFLEKEEYGIDAALWIGQPGQTGLLAVGAVLTGEINPSGGLVDTWAYDSLGSPAIINQGSFSVSNYIESENGVKSYDHITSYMVYAENIYVGYRYYETRYEDCVLNQGEADGNFGITANGETSWSYQKEVQYPFGYHSSYTTFSYSDYQVNEKDDHYEVSVKVTNNGNYDGKEIVQVYIQSPYTQYDIDNHIEKASVELVGFAKTSLLTKNGGNETVTVNVPKSLLAAYDADNKKTYIVEEGTYYLAVANDAHNAINNILKAKGKTTATGLDKDGDTSLVKSINVNKDETTYAVSLATNYPITNQFDDVDVRKYDSNFKYLSRNNWKNTYPVPYGTDKKWAFTIDMLNGSDATQNYTKEDTSLEMPNQNAQNNLTLATLIGKDFDDPAWELLLDEMSYKELADLVRLGGYQTQAVTSVGIPGTIDLDGPAGISTAAGISVSLDEKAFAWVCEVALSSTWNVDLVHEMGEMIGEDALANSQKTQNVCGWYAPGMNIHRTPYSGRNFEYYSEDGFLSGKMGAAEISGAVNKGVIIYMKHYALNDQEIGRTGGSMFCNEQAVRQLYLKPFELSTIEGGANGVMASMNRIGLKWSGGHKGLMTETLRNEWGFKGIAITDQASYKSFYYANMRQGLEAGTTMWLNTDNTLWLDEHQLQGYETNALLLKHLRFASKTILYTVANSMAMNGISSSSKIVAVDPLWKSWLVGVNVSLSIVVTLSGAFATYLLVLLIKSKKEPKIIENK